MRTSEIVEKARRAGHTLRYVPPGRGAIFSTTGDRWDCTRCHKSVYRSGRLVYGDAVNSDCPIIETGPSDISQYHLVDALMLEGGDGNGRISLQRVFDIINEVKGK